MRRGPFSLRFIALVRVIRRTLATVVIASGKLYVANYFGNTVTTYEADGTPASPTIATGLSGPAGIAVDAAGKIYVTNYLGNSLTTYGPDGTQTTPTIGGSPAPSGIALE